jgi:Transcriptional regulators
MKVTMVDVARKAGVSKTLVSRVINNDKGLSIPDVTRKRIYDVIDELGYIPDTTARALVGKSTGTSAMSQPITIGYITFTSYEKHGHPFFSRVIHGIEEEIFAQGCKLGTTFTAEEISSVKYLRDSIKTKKMDGLIYLGSIAGPLKEPIKEISEYGVCLDELVDESMDFVGTDYCKSGVIAIEHLISMGYKQIGFLKGYEYSGRRLKAYIETLTSNGLSPVEEWILDGKFNMNDAYEVTSRKLSEMKPPEAFFAWNDEMAIGCMRALQEKGFKVPEDVAVIGHDDINMAAFASTSLSTVKIHKKEIGKMAVKILIERVKSKRKVPIRVEFPGKLIVRDSCGAKLKNKHTREKAE